MKISTPMTKVPNIPGTTKKYTMMKPTKPQNTLKTVTIFITGKTTPKMYEPIQLSIARTNQMLLTTPEKAESEIEVCIENTSRT